MSLETVGVVLKTDVLELFRKWWKNIRVGNIAKIKFKRNKFGNMKMKAFPFSEERKEREINIDILKKKKNKLIDDI